MEGLILGDGADGYNKTIERIVELKSRRSYLIQTNISSNDKQVSAISLLQEQIQLLRDASRDLYRNYRENTQRLETDEQYLSGVVSNQATPGSYEIEIMDLAKPHILATENLPENLNLPRGKIQLEIFEEVLDFNFDGGSPNKLAKLFNEQSNGKLRASWLRKNHQGYIFVLKSAKPGRLSHIYLVQDKAGIMGKLGLYKANTNLNNKNKVLIATENLEYKLINPVPTISSNTISNTAAESVNTDTNAILNQLVATIESNLSNKVVIKPLTNISNQTNLSTPLDPIKYQFASQETRVLINREVNFEDVERVYFSYKLSASTLNTLVSLIKKRIKDREIALEKKQAPITAKEFSQPLTIEKLATILKNRKDHEIINHLKNFIASHTKIELEYEVRGERKSYLLNKPQKRLVKFSKYSSQMMRFNNETLNEQSSLIKLLSVKITSPDLSPLVANIDTKLSTLFYDVRVKPKDHYKTKNELQPAQGARLIYQSIELERDDNSVSDLIPGVSLKLKKVTDGPVKFNVVLNSKLMEDKMISFVSKYNQTIEYINIFMANDLKALGIDKLKENVSNKLGVLKNQFWVRRMKNRLRDIIISPYFINYEKGSMLLTQIGVENNYNYTKPTHIDADKIKFDTSVFNQEIAKNQDDFRSLFSYDSNEDSQPDNGFAWKMGEYLTELLAPNSFLRAFVLSKNNENKRLSTRLESEKEKIETDRKKLMEDFGKVQGLKEEQKQFQGFLDSLGNK